MYFLGWFWAQKGYLGATPEKYCQVYWKDGPPLTRWGKAGGTGVFHLEKRKLQVDLIAAFQNLKGIYERDGEMLVLWACSDRTRGSGSKLKESRFGRNAGIKFFTEGDEEQDAQRNCGHLGVFKARWMGLWAICSTERCPGAWPRVWD